MHISLLEGDFKVFSSSLLVTINIEKILALSKFLYHISIQSLCMWQHVQEKITWVVFNMWHKLCLSFRTALWFTHFQFDGQCTCTFWLGGEIVELPLSLCLLFLSNNFKACTCLQVNSFFCFVLPLHLKDLVMEFYWNC